MSQYIEPWTTEGAARIVESCAAWLDGISRHQIRELRFEALIEGEDFVVTVLRDADGTTHGLFVDGDGDRFRVTAATSRATKGPA